MIVLKAPLNICAKVKLPASKSISNRALIVQALCGERSGLQNLSNADDTLLLQQALQSDNELIDVGAAGTTMRFLTAYFAAKAGRTVFLTGSERMKQRPIGVLVEALRQMGANIDYVEKEGFPPLRIVGTTMRGGQLAVEAGISSQYISALLLIAPALKEGVTLTLTKRRVSLPYIEQTIQLMRNFGAKVQWRGDAMIEIFPSNYRMTDFTVENDWSAASYWYEIAALCSQATVTMEGLCKKSLQGDSKVANLFERLGVNSFFDGDVVKIINQGKCVKNFNYNFIDQPDLVQTFAVTCCLKNIPFCFTGVDNLALKETDRLLALCAELRKLGYILVIEGSGTLLWNGERCTPQERPVIDTYKDHRMAMALAPSCLAFPEIVIADEGVVSKSYPGFWDEFEKVGFVIKNV